MQVILPKNLQHTKGEELGVAIWRHDPIIDQFTIHIIVPAGPLETAIQIAATHMAKFVFKASEIPWFDLKETYMVCMMSPAQFGSDITQADIN